MNEFNSEKALRLSDQILGLIKKSQVTDNEGIAALKAAEQIVTQKAASQMMMDAFLQSFQGKEH